MLMNYFVLCRTGLCLSLHLEEQFSWLSFSVPSAHIQYTHSHTHMIKTRIHIFQHPIQQVWQQLPWQQSSLLKPDKVFKLSERSSILITLLCLFMHVSFCTAHASFLLPLSSFLALCLPLLHSYSIRIRLEWSFPFAHLIWISLNDHKPPPTHEMKSSLYLT